MDDLFFHVSALEATTIEDHSYVEFRVSEGPKGDIAIKIKVIDEPVD